MKKTSAIITLGLSTFMLSGCFFFARKTSSSNSVSSGLKPEWTEGVEGDVSDEREFMQVAEENTSKDMPYTTAQFHGNYKQYQGASLTHNLSGDASFVREDGVWYLTDSEYDSGFTSVMNPSSFIDFTMDQYSTFGGNMEAVFGKNYTAIFAVGEISTVRIVVEDFRLDSERYVKSAIATMKWDSYGCLVSFDETDNYVFTVNDVDYQIKAVSTMNFNFQ